MLKQRKEEIVSALTEEFYRDNTLEGVPVYGAYSRAPMSRWIAGVAVPVAVVNAGFRQSLVVVTTFGIFLLAIGLAGAFEISRRISRDIARAAGSADRGGAEFGNHFIGRHHRQEKMFCS